jgi:tetratricopeptide (TPR) repeat protein
MPDADSISDRPEPGGPSHEPGRAELPVGHAAQQRVPTGFVAGEQVRKDQAGLQAQPPQLSEHAAEPPAQRPTFRFAGGLGTILISLTLFLLVVGTFFPAVHNDFVGFDDPDYVTANAHVQRGLTWETVPWAFRSTAACNWHPLTWLSHMLDVQLFGLQPWGHHLTSILLHAMNTVLVFLVFKRMTGSVWRSCFVAAVFGVHPLHVESVAWISERKDVLSTFFWMLTLWAYAQYARGRTARNPVGAAEIGRDALPRVQADQQVGPTKLGPTGAILKCSGTASYVLALVFFALGLMSKPMLVTLPFVLLLLDYWPLREFKSLELQSSDPKELAINSSTHNSKLSNFLRLTAEKIPFFLLAAVVSGITYVVQKQSGSVTSGLPFVDRVENAVVSYCRYLGKLFCPVDLAVYYPYPDRWPATIVCSACLVLLVVSVFAIALRRNHPYLLVGWFWFIGTLAPVIGLVQVGLQAMADRYTYVPSLGIFVMLAWGIHDLSSRWRGKLLKPALAAALVIPLCIVLSRHQIGYWKDSETLFRRAIAVTKDNYLAYDNLGTALTAKGKLDEAVGEYQEALRIKPDFAEAHNNLGSCLAKKGELAEAIDQFVQALKLNPGFAEAHFNLAAALGDAGRIQDAIAQYQEAIRLKPDFTDARYNLGNVLSGMPGRLDDAVAQYLALLQIDPSYAEARYNLALVCYRRGNRDAARIQLQVVVKQRPCFVEGRRLLGAILDKEGRLDEAIRQYSEILRLKPDDATNRFSLAVDLSKQGRLDEGIIEFQEALRLKPDFAEARKDLDWVLGQKKASLHPSMPARP